MSTDSTGTAPSVPPLQFDRAETGEGTASVPACSDCKAEIRDVYFSANGQVFCRRCRAAVEARQTGGSGWARFARALGLGLLGAAAGALLYYAVLAATGYNIGLIALVVGFLVGMGVNKGSNGRGGWVYQTLAVALTYVAIGATFAPLIMKEFAGRPRVTATSVLDSAAAPAATAGAASPAADSGRVSRAADSTRVRASRGAKSTMHPLVALVLFVLVAGAAPIFSGSLINILIMGFALFEAWRLNKRVRVTFTGPHRVGAAQPASA